MVFGIYAIQDLKSTFMSPTVDFNDATAKRLAITFSLLIRKIFV
mgnify:CR=1 FL=1